MASVINSARKSTASTFDFVGNLANTANSLVTTGALAIDALHSKTVLMHTSVERNTHYQLKITDKRELNLALLEYTDMMEQTHKELFPDEPFDRKAFVTAALAELSATT